MTHLWASDVKTFPGSFLVGLQSFKQSDVALPIELAYQHLNPKSRKIIKTKSVSVLR